MSIARFVTWGGTGILTTETQDFGLIIKYGVSEKVNLNKHLYRGRFYATSVGTNIAVLHLQWEEICSK